jgi:hypothetical protein
MPRRTRSRSSRTFQSDRELPVAIATDYDIFLYEQSPTPRWWYSSQSVNDSVEGFDVALPEYGHYQVYLSWPNGSSGCGGGGSEPFAWAATWWP